MSIEWVKHIEVNDKPKCYTAKYREKILKVVKSGNYWLPIIYSNGAEVRLTEAMTFKEAKQIINDELNCR